MGLQSSSLNGAEGRLGKFSEKQGSWQVFLGSTDAAKAVKPENLEPLPQTAQGPGQGDATEMTDVAAQGSTADPPEPMEVLPADEDRDAWVELLRDAYLRQLRSDAKYPEPLPFFRATLLAANQNAPIPEGSYPAQALNWQLQMLLRGRGMEP